MIQEMQNLTNNSSAKDLFDLPVNTNVQFTNHKNIYKKRIEKRQRKLLKKVLFIRPFLHEGEEILFISTGCSPISVTEQLLTGWVIFYLRRSLFIFTNERIFHVPTKQDFSYRNSISQIFYSDCRSINIKGRSLSAEYKNGKKEKFLYIPGSEGKKIKAMLQELTIGGEPSLTPGRTHLCPRCTNPLVTDRYTCPDCSLEFKNKKEAGKVSIIYPGGGYFYTGHPFLGLGDALVEIYLTLLVIVVLIAVISGNTGSIFPLVFLSFLLTFEKALSVYHANHFVEEYIPKIRDIKILMEEPKSQPPAEVPAEPKPEEILSASWNNR